MSVERLGRSRPLARALGLALGLSASSALGQVTLTGKYLEVPIDAGGRLMAPGNASGVKFNPAGTGGGAGLDFWVWGTPVYNAAVAVSGGPAVVNGSGWVSGPAVTDLSTAQVRKARVAGSPFLGLELTRTLTFGVDDRVLVVTDTVRNSGTVPFAEVATLDAADPDQGVAVGCGSSTRNDAVSVGLGDRNLIVASVYGCGYPGGLSVAFGSFSPLARVSAGGFDNRDPYLFLVPNDPGDADEDVAINLATDFGTLGPGASRSVTWFAAFAGARDDLLAYRYLPQCSRPGPAISAADRLCVGSRLLAALEQAPSSPTVYWSVTPFVGNARLDGLNSDPDIDLTGTDAGRIALECTVVDNAEGCVHWLWKSVDLLAPPATPVVSSSLVVASGQAGLVATVPDHAGAAYAWTITNGTITAGQGTSTVTYTSGTPGELRLEVTETNAGGCAARGALSVAVAGPAGPCVADGTTLCLNASRFKVTVSWKTLSGATGAGQAMPLAPAPPMSGWFWFFQATNLEIVIKVLDGRGVNGAFWVLYGALSDVEYTITVLDTATGATKTYTNQQGTLASVADVHAFVDGGARPESTTDWLTDAKARGETISASALQAFAAEPPGERPAGVSAFEEPLVESAATVQGCVASGTALCLNRGRFRVQGSWSAPLPAGTYGVARTVPVSSDTGCFWFFDPRNVELAVKVLDGTAVNGHYWLFLGALSDVAYRLEVVDTSTGATRVYENPQGTLASRADLEAFPP